MQNKQTDIFCKFLTGVWICLIVSIWTGHIQAVQAQTDSVPVPHLKPVYGDSSEDVNTKTQIITARQAEQIALEKKAREQLRRSLVSLSNSLLERQNLLALLTNELELATDQTVREKLNTRIGALKTEIFTVEDEIDIAVLGLQFKQYANERDENDAFNLNEEIGKIFQPLILSLERVTEPSRRLEELRQLLEKVERRRQVADVTLENISRFQDSNTEPYPEYIQQRLLNYETIWTARLQEAIDLGSALDRQLEVAKNATGNTLTDFAENFGNFIINRGLSLFLALGVAFSFLALCQYVRIQFTNISRNHSGGVLNAPMRIFSLVITAISIVGALLIAMTIFNLRHDWLMLAFSLLFAVALAWSFVRALPTLIEESRILLNLGAVREGERTTINGVPYKIDKLSWYSKLINPALTGGVLTFPVKELIHMHSRPVVEGEIWFPTEAGDWIVRDNQHYLVATQTPEHVILVRPGGHKDYVPINEYLNTHFEIISQGYRRTHMFGLSYKHLALASKEIPHTIEQAARKRIIERIGDNNLLNIEVLLKNLGESSLDFLTMADIGPRQGPHWDKIGSDIANAVVDSCLEKGWEIPFPQIVVHKVE